MNELLRTNDIVLLSYAKSVLEDHGIENVVLDAHMSIVEGSLGVLPRRLMVADEQAPRARGILADLDIQCSAVTAKRGQDV